MLMPTASKPLHFHLMRIFWGRHAASLGSAINLQAHWQFFTEVIPDSCLTCVGRAPHSPPPPPGRYFARGQAASPVISHLVVSHQRPFSAPRALIYCLNISSAQEHQQKTSASAQKSPGGRSPQVRPPKHCAHALSTGFPRKCALSREARRKCPFRAWTVPCLALSVESARWVRALCPALHFRSKVHAGCLRCVLPCTFDRKCTRGACAVWPCTFDRKYALGSFVLSCLSVFACLVLPCLAFFVESARLVASFYLALHFRSKVHIGYLRPVLPGTFGRKCTLSANALSSSTLSTESTHLVLQCCPAFMILRAQRCVALNFWSKVLVWLLRSIWPCTFGRK